jgi:hypothetical protein
LEVGGDFSLGSGRFEVVHAQPDGVAGTTSFLVHRSVEIRTRSPPSQVDQGLIVFAQKALGAQAEGHAGVLLPFATFRLTITATPRVSPAELNN